MKHRFLVLDVFRGLFALLVVLFHLPATLQSPLVTNPLVRHADRFVDFFFVLSGFVIAYAYEDRLDTIQQCQGFIKSRFWRLYPLHLSLLLVYVLYVVGRQVSPLAMSAATLSDYSVGTLVLNLLLVNSIHWPGIEHLGWNMPTWSISAEFIAYALFGGLALTIRRWPLVTRLALFLAVIILAKLAIIYLNPTSRLTVTWDNGFLRGICGFFSGVMAWQLFQVIHATVAKVSRLVFSVIELLGCFLVIETVCYAPFVAQFWFSYELVFMLVIIIFGFERGILSGILNRSAALATLGKLSYSIYMIHHLVEIGFSIAFKRFTFQSSYIDTPYVIGVLVTVVLIATWTYKHVEMRFRHGISRLSLLH